MKSCKKKSLKDTDTCAVNSVSYRRNHVELLVSVARWRCIADGIWHITWHDITWNSMAYDGIVNLQLYAKKKTKKITTY